ncbi:MAG: competence/damage-inducible protein A [Candidatus Schekmanbacteria bacterium RBG_16_38_10]|uniref:CinA-like protein n=1 Tax=Candidatus Schekmanbacteria bacterium RBG_16_38_10 TaxID=1817879 RepID=A0A1F7RX50_9BACT|nr:MAG: competence/damage-inducible protein A [Candidatus Schekmanbacteria bacterium RBG_16_38_10]
MIAEIVSIGTELLLGQIVDTNSAFLSERLAAIGVDLYHKTVVGDNVRRIEDVLKLALSRSDIVITSGGLGPTEDDCTKEAVSNITSSPLEFDKETLENIRKIFSSRNSEMPKNNEVQAMFPRGSKILTNPRGTAPGFAIEFNGKAIVSLPGPPREFKPMIDKEVIPYICSRLKSSAVIKSKVLKIVGISESKLSEILRDIFMSSSNPTLAYLAGEKGITLRITAKATNRDEADNLISGMEEQVRKRIDKLIFGVDDDTLEGVVGKMLREKGLTLAVAESCTGGLISDRITDVPGSSEYFMLGAVTYSNWAKKEVLKVQDEMMKRYGAVSKEVAQAMAEGIKKISGTDIGVAVTGIAGPSGGTSEKPVGLVHIALSAKDKSYHREYRFGGERLRNKSFSAYMAIEMLRRYLLGYLDEE